MESSSTTATANHSSNTDIGSKHCVLTLADRVEVIREYYSYPKRPSYQSLATLFNCSSQQIKNIIRNQDGSLQKFEKSNPRHDDGKELREETRHKLKLQKIDLLDKVLLEYIERVVYYNYHVDEEKVRQKAIQIKECIGLKNFELNNKWFNNFKTLHGISEFKMESMRKNIQVSEKKFCVIDAKGLVYYVRREEQKSKIQSPNRLEKIDLLGKVLFEYIQRAIYNNYNVDEAKVRRKALQIKEYIALENFELNNSWFHHFKTVYKIQEYEIEWLRKNISVGGKKIAVTNAKSLVDYVRREERKSKIQPIKPGGSLQCENLQWQSQEPDETKFVCDDDDDDDEEDEIVEENCNDWSATAASRSSTKGVTNQNEHMTSYQDRLMQEYYEPRPKTPEIEMFTPSNHADSPIPDINSSEEALRHVKALLEYAMLENNYHAVGLISQLEQIFEKGAKEEYYNE